MSFRERFGVRPAGSTAIAYGPAAAEARGPIIAQPYAGFDCGVRQARAMTTEPRIWQWARARPADVIDLFVYVVVLNLAVEYAPSVISESFSISLLVAALLKVTLELVIVLKGQLVTRLRSADTRRAKLASAVSLWVVAAGSKLVVLELVDLVFGDAVSLGGFISVTLLVVALLASRAAVRRLLDDTAPTS